MPLYRFNLWSSDEHERFLHGLEMFPNGPWKEVAKVVGTKSTRQTMTHAQKYRQKIERRLLAHPKPTKPQKKATRSTKCASGPNYAIVDYFKPPSECTDDDQLFYGTAIASSPSAIGSEVFDTRMLEEEFDAILASFGAPLPMSGWAVGDDRAA